MVRPFKAGVDYFPLDVTVDEKIELLEAEHGLIGFGVLIKLYQKIYANNYWVTWNKRSILVFSNKVNVSVNEVTAIINSCLEWEIFDKDMLEKHEILTSRGIQKRFFEITKRRVDVEVTLEYLMVDEPKFDNITIVNVNSNSKNDSGSTQRKGKERKKKGKEFIYSEAFERWWNTYPKRNGRRVGKKPSSVQFEKLDKSEWKDLKLATKNYQSECNGLPKDADRFLKKDFWRDFIKPADKNEPNKSGSVNEMPEEFK